MKEQRELEALARELESEVHRLKSSSGPKSHGVVSGSFANLGGGSDSDLSAGVVVAWGAERPHSTKALVQPMRQVRWRLDGARDFPWEAPDASQSQRQDFSLAECPGVQFSLVFYPLGGSSVLSGRPTSVPSWMSALEVVGELATDGLKLDARLNVEAESATTGSSSPSSSSSYGSQTLGSSVGSLHLSRCSNFRAEAKCVGAWPRAVVADATCVICSAEITVVSWEPSVIRLTSDWDAIAELVPPSDESDAG
mmetsp:Transcript_20327/g.51565  ORF Transcript_20327/g.51565 Transcript_20327/m.51565 type:complete len:253 (-) Transcript_20327:110-868(-)